MKTVAIALRQGSYYRRWINKPSFARGDPPALMYAAFLWLFSGVKLTQNIIHRVDDRLRLVQLNLVTRPPNDLVRATGREMGQRLVLSEPLISIVSPKDPLWTP